MTVIVILLIIALIIFVIASSGKVEQTKTNVSENQFKKYDYVAATELRIQESKKLLDEIRNKYPVVENNFESNAEFEVVGIHINNRKKYILDNCSEYEEVFLKHEKKNRYSDRAIAVNHNNKLIGYISESEVEEVHDIVQKNFEAKISEIDYDGNYLIVKIIIEY